ncbi:MAG: hypothetical protein Roseis2KO_56260 [Roseivirga sp.]
MRAAFFNLLVFTSVLITACSAPREKTLLVTPIASPAVHNSLTPNLFTARDGKVYLSWLEKKDTVALFKFALLEENIWSAPNQIAEGSNWFVNWADFPSLIVNDGVFSAHWLQKRAAGTYDYDVRIAQSVDGGKTWGDSFIPHTDGIAAEHGFVSMLAQNNGQNFATWLDGRNTKMGEGESHHGHGGAMTLRAGSFDNNGQMISDTELDNRTCDCCQTAAAFTSSGPIVAYRDRSDLEIRDIYVTRQVDGKWSTPSAVFNDNWKIEGCPVNGPSISANGDKVAIAWFTAAQGFGEVKLAFSGDAGASFSNPVVLAKGNTTGRVGTSILSNGTTAISWMETAGDMAQIMLALFDKTGKEINRTTLAETSAARASGFPVITEFGEQLVASWTETGESSQVKTALITYH